MLIHDDVFTWRGWGAKLRLGSGRCRLRVYDLTQDVDQRLLMLRPNIVIVSDIETAGNISVRGWSGHIVTTVARRFEIDPQRMLYVEYYPPSVYGEHEKRRIPERYEAVDFEWREGVAVHPRWREPAPTVLQRIRELIGT